MNEPIQPVDRGVPIQSDDINRIAKEIAARTLVHSAGGAVRQLSAGTVIARKPSGLLPAPRRGSLATRTCPFDITITESAGPTFRATFRAGTINNLLPSNYLTGVEVPATGTRYLVLDCTASNGEITSAEFAADTDPPPAITPFAGQPPTAFKILIGVVIDTVATKVISCGNIQVSSVESFRLQKVSPAAGELPYDVYYTWDMAII